MTNEIQTMDALKQALQNQSEQSRALIQVIERMEAQEQRVDAKVTEVEGLVEEVSKRVHLEDAEASEIQKRVSYLASRFTRIFFAELDSNASTNLKFSKMGQFRSLVYKRLKAQFNVTKYTHIKHVDFNKAVRYLNSISYEDFLPQEIRMTPKQLEILKLEEVNGNECNGDFKKRRRN